MPSISSNRFVVMFGFGTNETLTLGENHADNSGSFRKPLLLAFRLRDTDLTQRFVVHFLLNPRRFLYPIHIHQVSPSDVRFNVSCEHVQHEVHFCPQSTKLLQDFPAKLFGVGFWFIRFHETLDNACSPACQTTARVKV